MCLSSFSEKFRLLDNSSIDLKFGKVTRILPKSNENLMFIFWSWKRILRWNIRPWTYKEVEVEYGKRYVRVIRRRSDRKKCKKFTGFGRGLSPRKLDDREDYNGPVKCQFKVHNRIWKSLF